MDNTNPFSAVKLSTSNVNPFSAGKFPAAMDIMNVKPPVFTGNTLFGSNTELMASFSKSRECWIIGVEGYDTSLPEDDIKKALTNHFRSCGVIAKVDFPRNPVDRHASVIIIGDDANEKALELNGSELGGRKLVVTAKVFPEVVKRDVPFGYTVPPGT